MKIVSKQIKYNSRLIGVLAFLLVFTFELCLNFGVLCIRSLPDEMGAMSLAAEMSGYDWSYVMTHPSQYYGFGTTLLMYPFFVFIDEPAVLYRCLLGLSAFLHAIPAYISIRLIQNYYKSVKNVGLLLLMGIVSALFTPTRATNIDNEPMLIVLCWIIVYLIVALQFNTEKNKKILYSVELAFVLCFSYLSHTRALIYSFVIFLVIGIFYFCTKKKLVHFPSFLCTFLIGISAAFYGVNFYQKVYYSTEETTVINNTTGTVASSAISKLSLLFSENGIRGFIDMIASNLWVIFVFSCGVIIVCICSNIKEGVCIVSSRLKKGTIDEKSIYFPEFFCVCGCLISLIGLAVLWLPSAVNVYDTGANLSRGHFYLRYYGNYFGPCILFFLLKFTMRGKEDKGEKGLMFVTLTLTCIITVYAIYNFVSVASEKYNHGLDWFYYFAPFSDSSSVWPEAIQTLPYFLSATLLVIMIFILIMNSNKIKNIALILAVFLIWQYSYSVMNFDIPFSSSDHYYGSVNVSYNLRETYPEIFDNADNFFYNNPANGPQYVVQFFFPDYQVITDLSLINNVEDNIILSSTMLNDDKINDNYSFVILDENEYLYINNEARKDLLIQEGYFVIDVE